MNASVNSVSNLMLHGYQYNVRDIYAPNIIMGHPDAHNYDPSNQFPWQLPNTNVTAPYLVNHRSAPAQTITNPMHQSNISTHQPRTEAKLRVNDKKTPKPQSHTQIWKPYHTQTTPGVKGQSAKRHSEEKVKGHSDAIFDFTQDLLDAILYGDQKCDDTGISKGDEPSVAVQTRKANPPLPQGLIYTSGTSYMGVYCGVDGGIPRGTLYGPYTGKQVYPSEMTSQRDNSHMWEVFTGGELNHFIDGSGPRGNWMRHVRCARTKHEQNVSLVQRESLVYYEVSRDVARGEELVVWYGDEYEMYMGLPIGLKDHGGGVRHEEKKLKDTKTSGFECAKCGKLFAYESYRDKHVKHTACLDSGDRSFPCHLCTRSFEKKERLRVHIRHVHERRRPHKCEQCHKTFAQSSSLRKHFRVHSGERPYKCVYCTRAFTASSILRTHLRQHNGHRPFQCKDCGKTFASHAAHDSHVKRCHPMK